MVGLRKAIQSQHSERCKQSGDQDRQLEGDNDERRPAMQWTAANVDRVKRSSREILHQISADSAGESSRKRNGGNTGTVGAQLLSQMLDWKRREAIHQPVPFRARLPGALDKIFGMSEFREESVQFPFHP